MTIKCAFLYRVQFYSHALHPLDKTLTANKVLGTLRCQAKQRRIIHPPTVATFFVLSEIFKTSPRGDKPHQVETMVSKQQRNTFAVFSIPANRYLQTCNDTQQHQPNLQRFATIDANWCQSCNDTHNKKPLHSDECNGLRYETRVKTENLFYVVVIPLMIQKLFSNNGLMSKRTWTRNAVCK